MTLNYKILWIEDEPESISDKISTLKEYLFEEKGFGSELQLVASYKDFYEHYGFDALKNFDLLLIDFNLDDIQHSGFDIIQDIREKEVYTEVVFYSSHYGDLKTKIQDNYVEGIFIADRSHLNEKVENVIDVSIKKVQDVNNLRGLIMAEVAELDRLKKAIIKKHCENVRHSDDTLKNYVSTRVFEKFKEDMDKYSFLTNKTPDAYQAMDLASFIEDLIFDSYKKARTAHKINKSNHTGIDFDFSDYSSKIISKRNVLAHEKEFKRESDNTPILKYPNGSDFEFTEEHCIQIRKDINKYKMILDDIYNKLSV